MINRIKSQFYSCIEKEYRKEFYRKLLGNRRYVFDIGANIGNRTQIFVAMGCKVVAVEPNPVLAKKLYRKFGKKIKIIEKSVGGEKKTVDLYINDADVLSTTSDKWLEKIKESRRFAEFGNNFNKKIPVEQVTLNELFDDYGIPQFIKIDTEGVEYDIIKNIDTSSIDIISFEFAVPESKDESIMSIKHLEKVGYTDFNISLSESMAFISPNNMQANELIDLLNHLPVMSWGDVYAFNK